MFTAADVTQKQTQKPHFLLEISLSLPTTESIILFGHCAAFEMSPNLPHDSTICRRTTSYRWAHESQTAIFVKTTKPPPHRT